jgi:hypothetical protein
MSAAAARLRLRRLGVQRGRCGRWWACIERHRGGVLESALKLVVKEPTLDNPDGGADLGGGPVGAAQQRRGALEATADPIACGDSPKARRNSA